jgi:hypothetical protein
VIQADSTIFRWNEIASRFGHGGTKVAVTSNSFLVSDVEEMAATLLSRNLGKSEADS